MPLTDVICRNAKAEEKTRRIFDGKGLYLEVTAAGRKYWRMKYRHAEKEKRLALGVYPEITLKQARKKCLEARDLLERGLDPSHEKKRLKIAEKANVEHAFEAVAREWHSGKAQSWTLNHSRSVITRLEADIFPSLGFRPINEITAPELLAVIRVIEKRGALDISKRALQTCGQIFRYAVATGSAERDISADLKGALKTRKPEHHARLDERELPEFFQRLAVYDGELKTQLALRLLVLTFVRTNELIGARRDEFDLEKNEWRIPAERMKMRDPHIVPLCPAAMDIVMQLQQMNGGGTYLFPQNNNPQKTISNNTMLFALYRMGYHGRTTTHGFRATASTILNENGFTPDVIERQLAHAERNQVRAAYNHAQYLPERREMMQWWGDYIERVTL